MRNRRSLILCLLFAALLLSGSALAQWLPLGPDGGDVRSLTFDPRNPDRMFLGTSAGQLYLSANRGQSWSRFAHLGEGNDYVLDNMEIDPHSGTIYVAAWSASIERQSGDLFRSSDGGKTWQALSGMRGKSIRAMALAQSDPRIVTVGALDGVFRSHDGGNNWERISPANHAEIKNIESIAVDPRDPSIVYAGTWHLAWKTEDGGRNWHSIKRGVVDDSDVFSIIVDYSNPQTVYLSACSGIYKSENAAELFHKIQGIPFSARRTRVLKQDPVTPGVVYAGTTEGLWKTSDAGQTWRRITPANIIVNDVHVDPRQAARVLIATDRSGVLASNDMGATFAASNRGFAHRQVAALLVDRSDPQLLYAGLLNDKEFGGVFRSSNGGRDWQQISNGLERLDVFALRQSEHGALIAGTNHGVYVLDRGTTVWRPANTIVREKSLPALKTVSKKSKKAAPPRVELVKSELRSRVAQIAVSGDKWFAATFVGLFTTADAGKSWKAAPVAGNQSFVAVQAADDTVIAATLTSAVVSQDGGKTWSAARVPSNVTAIYGVAIAPDGKFWLATREGAFRSSDFGNHWEHVLDGLPAQYIINITPDAEGRRLLAVSSTGEVFASRNNGGSWKHQSSGFVVRSLAVSAAPDCSAVRNRRSAGAGPHCSRGRRRQLTTRLSVAIAARRVHACRFFLTRAAPFAKLPSGTCNRAKNTRFVPSCNP